MQRDARPAPARLSQRMLTAVRTSNEVELAEAIAEEGVAAVDASGRTALHVACFSGKLLPVRTLLQAGAAVNKACRVGKTALHIAAGLGFTPVVALLLQAGASVDRLDHVGRSALHEAAHWGQQAVLQLLVQAGASVQLRTVKYCLHLPGSDALHIASRSRRAAVAGQLCFLGCFVDAVQRRVARQQTTWGWLDGKVAHGARRRKRK
eukprot:PLAT2499.1.p1 GENE.PLAT2499.1~~PLAT2499.1.p1  ORF type:complete len:207 (-),score=72.96 PLAT2499.1:8-628(-)